MCVDARSAARSRRSCSTRRSTSRRTPSESRPHIRHGPRISLSRREHEPQARSAFTQSVVADAAFTAPNERMHVAAAVFMRDELVCSFVNRCWRRRANSFIHHFRSRLSGGTVSVCARRRRSCRFAVWAQVALGVFLARCFPLRAVRHPRRRGAVRTLRPHLDNEDRSPTRGSTNSAQVSRVAHGSGRRGLSKSKKGSLSGLRDTARPRQFAATCKRQSQATYICSTRPGK